MTTAPTVYPIDVKKIDGLTVEQQRQLAAFPAWGTPRGQARHDVLHAVDDAETDPTVHHLQLHLGDTWSAATVQMAVVVLEQQHLLDRSTDPDVWRHARNSAPTIGYRITQAGRTVLAVVREHHALLDGGA